MLRHARKNTTSTGFLCKRSSAVSSCCEDVIREAGGWCLPRPDERHSLLPNAKIVQPGVSFRSHQMFVDRNTYSKKPYGQHNQLQCSVTDLPLREHRPITAARVSHFWLNQLYCSSFRRQHHIPFYHRQLNIDQSDRAHMDTVLKLQAESCLTPSSLEQISRLFTDASKTQHKVQIGPPAAQVHTIRPKRAAGTH